MKTTELQMLWNLVKAGEDRPLSRADLRLLMRVRSALLDYGNEIRVENRAVERRCRICRVPVSKCCC